MLCPSDPRTAGVEAGGNTFGACSYAAPYGMYKYAMKNSRIKNPSETLLFAEGNYIDGTSKDKMFIEGSNGPFINGWASVLAPHAGKTLMAMVSGSVAAYTHVPNNLGSNDDNDMMATIEKRMSTVFQDWGMTRPRVP